jgi:hypothetical protein
MVDVVRGELDTDVNVPEGDLTQYISALGAAVLGRIRLRMLARENGNGANGDGPGARRE